VTLKGKLFRQKLQEGFKFTCLSQTAGTGPEGSASYKDHKIGILQKRLRLAEKKAEYERWRTDQEKQLREEVDKLVHVVCVSCPLIPFNLFSLSAPCIYLKKPSSC
jgi:hypothetical protein